MKVICFAGPNGSGKTTIIERAIGLMGPIPLVCADFIEIGEYMSSTGLTDSERTLLAAQLADSVREKCLREKKDFAFETVLSDITSDHNKLDFLKRAKEEGARIIVLYALTRDKEINVRRIFQKRVPSGGHPVPEDKIRSRYDKCMIALPEVINVSDQIAIYDNSIDFQTSILLNKYNENITIYSNNPKEDEFLQNTIIGPLQKYPQYNIVYEKSPKQPENKRELGL